MLRHLLVLFLPFLSAAQFRSTQSSDWNSTFSLSQQQINRAELDDQSIHNVNTAIRFERTNWTAGSVVDDPFYQLRTDKSHLPPGSLLAKEEFTNTSFYTLSPSTAVSRIIFRSQTFNGSTVPASAYILWPWMPREDLKRPGQFAVVGWGHRTSGIVDECAPSHIRNLWYQYSGPYILALQGYVVVAPDYAGLGVSRHVDGRPFKHTWMSSAQGNDLIDAVKAAQEAFPQLSDRFVLAGHSQGGHAVWAAARSLAYVPEKGYLGAIAASPGTNISLETEMNPLGAVVNAFGIAAGMDEIYPSFDPLEWLTENGVGYLNLMKEIGACNSALVQLILQPGLIKPDCISSHYFRDYAHLTANSGRLFEGPMLILQGTNNSSILPESVSIAVNETCRNYPNSELENISLKGVDHVPVMYASQRIWLDWIADRFAGRNAVAPCTIREYTPARPVESYQKQLGYYLEFATQVYLGA